jgi:hypothetical protein
LHRQLLLLMTRQQALRCGCAAACQLLLLQPLLQPYQEWSDEKHAACGASPAPLLPLLLLYLLL